MQKIKVKSFGEIDELTLVENNYTNGRIGIRAICNGETYGVLTVNVPHVDLENNEIVVKNYSENKEWVPQVLDQLPEVLENTGRTVEVGWEKCPVYRYKGLQ